MLAKLLPRWLRRGEDSFRDAHPAVTSEQEITYQPHLITELQADHRELLRLFRELVVAHRMGNVEVCLAKLKRFTHSLRAHLLRENLHLYAYLSQSLSNDPESSELMTHMRREMQAIGRTLNEFATRYTATTWNASLREALSMELDHIAEILDHRIHHEENKLYPLYMPPGAYR